MDLFPVSSRQSRAPVALFIAMGVSVLQPLSPLSITVATVWVADMTLSPAAILSAVEVQPGSAAITVAVGYGPFYGSGRYYVGRN
jgi:hypothetical protein